MIHREQWPPAVVARSVEHSLFGNRSECSFDTTKNKQIILIPGMGAPVSQLFELVNDLRSDPDFQDYGISAAELGLSLGDFSLTLDDLIQKTEEGLLSQTNVDQVILYGHSHGGRFACELATHLINKYSDLDLIVITGGTPIVERPKSFHNWLMSASFREWPQISQPELEKFFVLYSLSDKVVNIRQATTGSLANLIELENFSHNDFRKPEKMIPVIKKIPKI